MSIAVPALLWAAPSTRKHAPSRHASPAHSAQTTRWPARPPPPRGPERLREKLREQNEARRQVYNPYTTLDEPPDEYERRTAHDGRDIARRTSPPRGANCTDTSGDLVGQMAGRLRKLEESVLKLRAEASKRDLELRRLRHERGAPQVVWRRLDGDLLRRVRGSQEGGGKHEGLPRGLWFSVGRGSRPGPLDVENLLKKLMT